MSSMFTISEASEKTDLNKKTIRFYEEIGLITSIKRKENNYRYFTDKQIRELQLIKKVRDLGLPISEIKKLMKGCGEKNCSFDINHMMNDLATYIITIDARIKELKLLKTQLINLRENIGTGKSFISSNKHCCNLLKQLSDVKAKGGDE